MQSNNFDLLANLPAIFFAFCFFINFIIFSWGGIVLLLAKGDQYKIEKGKKLFNWAFTILFIILLLLAVFFIISYLLQQGEVFKVSGQASEEFPPSYHLGVFPPEPQFINIEGYNFTGPFEVDLMDRITELAIFAVFCDDKLLYIGDNIRSAPALNQNYSCWLENCGNQKKNIRIAFLWTPADKYDPIEKTDIKNKINKNLNPPCIDQEE